jgi:DNA repair protein RecO (recombination protein O)
VLTKTTGIIIRTVKYGESSAITNIYTEQYGLLGFHIPGVFRNKGIVRISYLQNLNAVDLTFNYHKSKNLQRITEMSCRFFPDLQDFNQKALHSIACELLQQTIRENEHNPALFDYLHQQAIPGLNNQIHYWQLPFMMLKILHHYGCSPNIDSYEPDTLLDLQNGVFCKTHIPLKFMSGKTVSATIYDILTQGINHLPKDAALRHQTIEDLIAYYRLHINENFDLRSRDILYQVVNG